MWLERSWLSDNSLECPISFSPMNFLACNYTIVKKETTNGNDSNNFTKMPSNALCVLCVHTQSHSEQLRRMQMENSQSISHSGRANAIRKFFIYIYAYNMILSSNVSLNVPSFDLFISRKWTHFAGNLRRSTSTAQNNLAIDFSACVYHFSKTKQPSEKHQSIVNQFIWIFNEKKTTKSAT